MPSGWIEQRSRCDIPKLSPPAIAAPAHATAGMHLASRRRVSIPPRANAPNRFIAKCAAAVHAATSAAVTNHGPPPPKCRRGVRPPPPRLPTAASAAASSSRAALGGGGEGEAARVGGDRRWGGVHLRPRARGLTRVAAGLDRAGAAHRRRPRRRRRRHRRRAADAAAVGAVHVPPTVLTKQPAKNALVKTKTGDAERIPLLPGVAALSAPDDDEKSRQSGAGARSRGCSAASRSRRRR